MLGNREDAEEALQDAFVRAYRSLERCDDGARFGAWLYGILVNRCRTTGARAAKRGRVFVRDEAALNGVAHPSRSEEHTSELQSQSNLVCRLLLEKKKKRAAAAHSHA